MCAFRAGIDTARRLTQGAPYGSTLILAFSNLFEQNQRRIRMFLLSLFARHERQIHGVNVEH